MTSLLVVNYRSANLAIDAIRSARESTSGPLQVVIVDNSVDDAQAESLRPHCDVLIVSPANVGYAAAINAGRAKCAGPVMIVSNPDVLFRANAVDTLAAALDDQRVAVAGPALYWDDRDEWILPPSDAQTLIEKIDEAIASRWHAWFAWRDRRRVRRRLAFWSLREATPMLAISGAVMAISLREFDEAGGFDERFRLYFEETDFLRRVSARGKRILYLPAARCRHLYNQSAGRSPEAAALYAASEAAYFEKWYGRVPAKAVLRLARDNGHEEPPSLDGPIAVPADAVIEASPLRSFTTAAGHFPRTQTVELPAEVWRSYQDRILYLRTVRRSDARVLSTWALYR